MNLLTNCKLTNVSMPVEFADFGFCQSNIIIMHGLYFVSFLFFFSVPFLVIHSIVSFCSDKAYFVDLFVRASNTPAIKMYEKVSLL